MGKDRDNFKVTQSEDKYAISKRDWSFEEVWELRQKTKLDGTFQRWGGVDRGSGWTHEQSRNWLANAVQGSTINVIVVAKVARCLRNAEENNDRDSIEYFEKLKNEGKEYVSMDGNNTTDTIYHFMENHPEMYLMMDNKKIYFKDLPEETQRTIRSRQRVTVHEFTEILVDDMCAEFRNFNTSTALNAQEHRQAQWSEMSSFVMDLSNKEKNRQMFKKLPAVCSDDRKLDTRAHEEMIAQYAMKVRGAYDVDVKRDELDSFYEQVFELEDPVKNKMERTLGVLGKMSAGFKENSNQKLSKGTFHNLIDLVHSILYDYNMEIKDPQQLYDWFIKHDLKFKEESKQVTEEDRDECSYKHWADTFNQKKFYQKTKEKFGQSLYEDLEDLEERGVIKCKRTSKDSFTLLQKKQLATLQEWQTRRDEPFTIYDLMNGLLEADHVRSVKDGGETIIPNGELMFRNSNRSKGAKSNEPHFDFQRG